MENFRKRRKGKEEEMVGGKDEVRKTKARNVDDEQKWEDKDARMNKNNEAKKCRRKVELSSSANSD